MDLDKLTAAAHRAYPGMWHRPLGTGSLEHTPFEIGLTTYELPSDVVAYLEMVRPEKVLELIAELKEMRGA